MSANGSTKKRIGMYWAASCGGCDISFLEIGPRILELIQVADVVFWPCAADFKYKDVAGYPDGHIDYCLFNGGVRNSEQEEVARLLRKKSKTLVAYGECAVDGGIPALANLKSRQEIYQASYHDNPSTVNPQRVEPQEKTETPCGEVEIPSMYDQVLRLKDVVEVDYEIPGCPPLADRVWEALQALISGAVPARNQALKVGCSLKAVCDECPRPKRLVKIKEFKRPHQAIPEPDWCFLEQGFVCTGPATRSGCGALCIKGGLPCRGCYGPSGTTEDLGTAMVSAIGSILAAEKETEAQRVIDQIVDPVGTFYRFTLSSSYLKGRK
jgi:F420-non-reducing hydrogenase small subunit